MRFAQATNKATQSRSASGADVLERFPAAG